jgi:hypothetical protein
VKDSYQSLIIPADHPFLGSRTNRRDKINKKEKHANAQTSNRNPYRGHRRAFQDQPGYSIKGYGQRPHALSSHWSGQFSLLSMSQPFEKILAPLSLDFLLGSQTESTPAPPVGIADQSLSHMASSFIFCFFFGFVKLKSD